jgi:Ca2+-binding EF-hand superfamily protein
MNSNVKYLTDEEIKQFLKELDSDNDGIIAYHEVETKLDEVSREIGKKQDPLVLMTISLTRLYSARTSRTQSSP